MTETAKISELKKQDEDYSTQMSLLKIIGAPISSDCYYNSAVVLMKLGKLLDGAESHECLSAAVERLNEALKTDKTRLYFMMRARAKQLLGSRLSDVLGDLENGYRIESFGTEKLFVDKIGAEIERDLGSRAL